MIDHFSGACTAVELELSVKGSRRLKEIMEAYLYDYVLERVLYITDQRQVAEVITRAAESVGVSEKVTIVRTSLPLSTGVLGIAVPVALSGVAS